jgi:beta-galactosidase
VNGFLPFIVDITPYVQFGATDNVLAARLSGSEGFYTFPTFSIDFRFGQGCYGLWRPVWMHITDKVYIPRNVYSVVNNWGTYVSTITATDASATVKILTNVQNDGAATAAVTLTTKVVDAANTVVWSEDKSQTVNPSTNSVFDQTATVSGPRLWYPANSIYGRPNVYKVYHIVKVNGAVVDVFTSPLGIRTITWDKDFPIINGHPHYLWGAASRYDYPALAAAVPEEQQWRDAKILTECGGNLWRPGHSTSSPEFVAACDAYGVMLVQPSGELEGNFATAQITPYKISLKTECHRDMIVRDRNNPSVLSWEVSNGPIDAAFEQSLHDLDSVWDPVHTRAMSDRGYGEAVKNGIADIYACSFVGCEVGLHTGTPQKPAWGAEGWSYTNRSSRFAYDYELSFASQYVQNWKKSRAANCFGLVQWYFCETPGEYGAFMETAQTPRSFGTSMLDFNRIPKMLYNIYKACWIPFSLKPNVSIAHHWNRSGNVRVNVFSNCPKVRLLINNVSQGEKTPNPWNTANNEENNQNTTALSNQCWWDVTWAAGTVRAEGLDANGTVVCSDQKTTAGAPHHIALTVEPPLVKPDGNAFKITANATDAAFILAKIVDATGNWCPTAGNTITFSVTGPGNYRGGSDQFVGTGGANWHGPGDPDLSAEGGMCKVAVRSTFSPGTVTVNAASPGLGSGSASFTTYPVSDPTHIDNQAFSPGVSQLQTIQMHAAGSTLRYFVGTLSQVTVELLDAQGRIVDRVAQQGPGWHSIRLTAPTTKGYNSGAGVYFVRCAVDGIYQNAKRFFFVR